MSAIAGIFQRSGESLDPQMLSRLAEGLEPLAPDGVRFEFSTRVGMTFRRYDAGCREDRTTQPKMDDAGHLLAFDGWLDNGQEIASALGGELGDNPTSLDLILAVYRRWGISGFARLVGNFAFALWDPHLGQLMLATDPLGFRPLYVHVDEDRLAWSSRARPLAEALGIEIRIDREFVASFLANSVTPNGPFEGIESLPGGHVLIADAGGIRRRRYWSFDPQNEIRYATDAEYEEHFSELFEQAVACRLPDRGPVFAELSGGVDSSTIVCIADELCRAHGNRDLHTVSYVFDQATSADERPYIREIEKVSQLTTHHLLEEHHPILSKRPPAGWKPDLPTNQISYLARYDTVAELMEAHGAGILLSGLGGDQVFLSEALDVPLELADLWVEGRPADMLRAGYRWARSLRKPLYKVLWQGGVLPLRRDHGRAARSRLMKIGEWLTPDFVEDTALRQRGLGPSDDLGFRQPSRSAQYCMLRQTMRIFALQKMVSQRHFEVRYPYLDRRLLEFALAIPLEQKLRPFESRSLVRRALRGRVPDAVLNRRTKAGPTEAFQRAIAREHRWLGSLFSEPILERIGVIDGKTFRQSLQRARHGIVSHPSQMHRTISLELWLRSMESNINGAHTTAPMARQTAAAGDR